MNIGSTIQCKNCGQLLDSSAGFCFNCGAKVELPPQNENVCASCGAELKEGFQFCFQCGAKVEIKPEMTFCTQCGAQVASTAEICLNCGCAIVHKPVAKAKKATNNSAFIKTLVKKSVVLFVSLLLLIFSFLPVTTYEQNVNDVATISIGYSAIDNVTFMFDSFKQYEDYDDIELTYEFHELQDEIERYDLDSKYGIRRATPLLEKAYNLRTRIYLQSSEYQSQPIYIFAGIFSLVYVIVAVLFFCFAAADFAIYLIKRNESKFCKASTILLSLVPCMAVLTYISTLLCQWDKPIAQNIFNSNVGFTTTAILSIVFGVLAIIYLLIDRTFISKTSKIYPGQIVKRSISIVATAVMLFALCMPVMSMTVTTIFDDRYDISQATVNYDASVFGLFVLNEDSTHFYETMDNNYALSAIESYVNHISNYDKREFVQREADSAECYLMEVAFYGFGAVGFSGIITIIPLIGLLIAAMATLLMWQNLYAVASENAPMKGVTIPAQIFGILLAIILVAGIIVFSIICNYNIANAEFDLGCGASLSIGAGAIVAIISAIVATCIPMGKKKQATYNYQNNYQY